MHKAEILFFWAALFSYVGAFCLYLPGFAGRKKSFTRYALWLLWIGFILHTVTMAVRWIAANHAPVTDIYELNLTGTWFTVLVFIVFERIRKADPAIILIVSPVAFLVMGHGFMSRTETTPMGPAYRSPWLVVHVIFAWLAFGSYVVSTGAATLILLREKLLARKPHLRIHDILELDNMSYRFIVLGFINHAVMLISGAIWAKQLWGHYWSWDALETWSLLAFLFYAFYLHARAFLRWKTIRAAWLAVVGLIVMAISFWGVDWFAPSIHPGP